MRIESKAKKEILIGLWNWNLLKYINERSFQLISCFAMVKTVACKLHFFFNRGKNIVRLNERKRKKMAAQ